jgi:tetratricopeptide (TPR) repeat protein
MLRNLVVKFSKPCKRSLSFGSKSCRTLKRASRAKEWSRVFRQGIEILKSDPCNTEALRILADACAQCHYNECELAYLKSALDAKPKDIEVNRHCGRSLARMGQFDQAIGCWHRIEMLRNGDAEAARMIALLSEEKLKYPGLRPTTAPPPPKAAMVMSTNEEETEELSELSPRQQLEQAIMLDPTNVANYLELALLLLRTDQFQQAEAAVLRGLDECGDDFDLKSCLNQIHEARLQRDAQRDAARKKEIERRSRPARVPWLEIATIFCVIILVLQVAPSVASAALMVVDVHQWSSIIWCTMIAILLLVLCIVHFGART